MALAELRQAREQSPQELARSMKVKQPAVAKNAPICMCATCAATSRRPAARLKSPPPGELARKLKPIACDSSCPVMNAPKDKSSLLLPVLGLFALVAVRMALSVISRDRGTPPPARGRSEPTRPSTPPDEGTTTGASPDPTRERRIRERAFQIWLEEGKPDGRDHEHWRRAESEMDR